MSARDVSASTADQMARLADLAESSTSVSVGRYTYDWQASATRKDPRPDTGLIYTDDRESYLAINGGWLQFYSYGETLELAVDRLLALVEASETMLGGEA